MTTIYRKVLAPARKPYRIGLLLTNKNGDTRAVDLDWGVENGSSHRFSIYRGSGVFMLIT